MNFVDESRCGRSSVKFREFFSRVDQCDTGTVDTGNGASGELGDLAQQVFSAAGAGHQPGQPA